MKFKVGDKVKDCFYVRGVIIKINYPRYLCHLSGDCYEWYLEDELELINE